MAGRSSGSGQAKAGTSPGNKAASAASDESDEAQNSAEPVHDKSLDDTAAETEQAAASDDDSDDDAEKERLRRRALLGRFWSSAKDFWSPRTGDRLAWPLTIGVALLVILAVLAQYGINVWNRKIFDALEKRDSASVLVLALVFFPLAAASVGVGFASVFGRMSMQRRWRAWLSDHVLNRWLSNGRYYQLNLVSGDHQNPEGRLTEDLRVSTDAPIDFAVGVSTATLSALTFIAVLWTIGGALTVSFGASEITIPGFLVIAAVIYSVVASGAMAIVGKRFVACTEAKNQAEADYRYAGTRERRKHRPPWR